MEKASGVPLDSVYRNMGVSDRWSVAQAIAEYQVKWAKIRYEAYGSLYFASDLDGASGVCQPTPEIATETSKEAYAIGPTNARDWYDDDRFTIKMDRGPCKQKGSQCMSPR